MGRTMVFFSYSLLTTQPLPHWIGAISASEFAEAMESLGLSSSAAEAQEIISEIDQNKDGQIDFHGTVHPYLP